MAVARVRIVIRIVAGNADEEVRGRLELDRPARRPDVAIVIVEAVVEVLAEAVAAEPRRRGADPDPLGERRASGNDEVGLLVGAEIGADAQHRLGGEAAGDIFDRAADRVAAVERALRSAQDLDPLDVVNVEHGRLRAVEDRRRRDRGRRPPRSRRRGSCWPTPRMKAVSVVLVPREVSMVTFGVVSVRSVMSIAPWRSSASPE